jgi:hydroxyacylglutathione hydrolase
VAGRQGVHRFDDFVIYNQHGTRDQLSLAARGLLHKVPGLMMRLVPKTGSI